MEESGTKFKPKSSEITLKIFWANTNINIPRRKEESGES